MGDYSRSNLFVAAFMVSCLSCTIKASPLFVRHQDDVNRPPALDKLLIDAVTGSKELSFFYDLKQGFLKTEIDILMTIDEYKELMSPNGRAKRALGIYPTHEHKRWTNNTVYYEFDSSFTDSDKDEVQKAFDDWSHFTCIQFEDNSWSENRIVIRYANGCYSHVGMDDEPQTLGLGYGCRKKRIVLHELGHVIGLYHEQARPDRDDYVTVNLNNIRDEKEYNFNKHASSEIMDLGIPYDYSSIMHYSDMMYSENGNLSIVTKDPKYQKIIGTVNGLSFLDIKTANIMYKCGTENGCRRKDSECPTGGFVGKDCTCWCPGNPAKHCYSKDDKEKGSLEQTCLDKRPFTCAMYASRGYCNDEKSDTRLNCPKSCNNC